MNIVPNVKEMRNEATLKSLLYATAGVVFMRKWMQADEERREKSKRDRKRERESKF